MNLGNPEEVKILELAQLVISTLGSRSEIVFTPRPEDDPEVRCPDISLAGRELGWEPTITLREGLDKTIAWARTAWRTSG
jgi:dTDP-glucose 4,6-dehydratase